MSGLYDENGQDNPDGGFVVGNAAERVQRAVAALETNKAAVGRWFWKGLLALNLVVWTFALPLFLLVRFG